MRCEYTTMEDYYGVGGIVPRGYRQWICEIDDDDIEEIIEQIIEWIVENGYIPPKNYEISVFLINPYTDEEVEFEINPYDYMTEEEMENDYITKKEVENELWNIK